MSDNGMGTRENLAELVQKLRATRERLEETADRAAELQRRLRADAPTILSLDKLARNQGPRRPGEAGGKPPLPPPIERFEGDEIAAASDAWEISLINEEG
jgi:hypothetical protein